MTVVTLPPELAPTLRAAAEQLIAECGEADDPRRPQPRAPGRGRCHVCRQRGGKLGDLRLTDGTNAQAHRSCRGHYIRDERAKAAR